jgi:zinc protease
VLVALERKKQSPRTLVKRAFYKNLFVGHPYSNPPTGEVDGVRAIGRQDLIDFHQKYFVAANGVVAMVGDLSRQQAEHISQQLVDLLPTGEAARRVSSVPELTGAVEREIDYPSQQSHLLMGQPGISRGDRDYFPLYVGNHILGGSGLISRLAVELREKRGLAYSAYSYFLPMRARGPFAIGLQTRNDQTQTAVKIARETLNRFVEQGPTEEELEAAKRNITGGFPLLIDSNKKIADHLMQIGFYNLPLNYLQEYAAKIQAVTSDGVADAFRRRVDPTRLVRIIVGGKSG